MRFFMIPRALVENPKYNNVSNEAILLYGIMFDLRNLSEKNKNKYTDENGNVYIIYTIARAKETLKRGKNKVENLYKELEDAKLITRKKIGGKKPDMIYVHDVVCVDTETTGFENKTSNQNKEVYNSNHVKTEDADVPVSVKPDITPIADDLHSNDKVCKSNPSYINNNTNYDISIDQEDDTLSTESDSKPIITYSEQSPSDQSLDKNFVQDVLKAFPNTEIQELPSDKISKIIKRLKVPGLEKLKEKIEENGLDSFVSCCYNELKNIEKIKAERGKPVISLAGYFSSYFSDYILDTYESECFISKDKAKKQRNSASNPLGYGTKFAVKSPVGDFSNINATNSNSVDPYDPKVLQMNALSAFLGDTYTLA